MSDSERCSSHYFQEGGVKILKSVVGKFHLPLIKINHICASNFSSGISYSNNSLYGFSALVGNYCNLTDTHTMSNDIEIPTSVPDITVIQKQHCVSESSHPNSTANIINYCCQNRSRLTIHNGHHGDRHDQKSQKHICHCQ